MKSVRFSKLPLVLYLVAAGMSGCGDSGGTNNSGTQAMCSGATGQPCQCPNLATGFQLCQPDGQWGVCSCSGQPMGTGGFGNTPYQGGGAPPGGPVCGDGVVTSPEQCDGQNHNNQNCAVVSMGACQAGYLICTPTCIFDYTSCICNGAGGSGGTLGTGGTVGLGGTTGQP